MAFRVAGGKASHQPTNRAAAPCDPGAGSELVMRDVRRLHEDIDTAERLWLIADHPVGEIIGAPGHRTLRDPEAVAAMAARIAMRDTAWLSDKKILVGIFTATVSGDVVIRAVECLDGHHRLLAGLRSGVWKLLCDVPYTVLDARVNGFPEHASGPEDRWIPLEVATASSLRTTDWRDVTRSDEAKGPTAAISGRICSLDEIFEERHRGVPLREL
jgi:hypothetical protein